MVVLLVASLFVVFVLLDLIQERRRRRELETVGAVLHQRILERRPRFVAGFELPEDLHYHRGHAWVHWVAPDQVYVGMDDFARRLIGADARLVLPHVGAWTEQGRMAVEVRRDAESVDLVAPVTGEVIAVNPAIESMSAEPHRDCYGCGWLYKVRAPRLFEQLGNLLDGSLASRWMEDTRERFQHQLVLATGSVIQDGGAVVDDVAAHLEAPQWRELAETFLSSGHRRD